MDREQDHKNLPDETAKPHDKIRTGGIFERPFAPSNEPFELPNLEIIELSPRAIWFEKVVSRAKDPGLAAIVLVAVIEILIRLCQKLLE